MSRVAIFLVVGAFLFGCGSRGYDVTSPDGLFTLRLGDVAELERDGDKTLWRRAGVRVTAQTIAIRRGRTLSATANAMVKRVELGELRGELRATECRVGEAPAFCLKGHTVGRRGARVERSGFLLDLEDKFVWVEALGENRAEVDAEAERLVASFARTAGAQ